MDTRGGMKWRHQRYHGRTIRSYRGSIAAVSLCLYILLLLLAYRLPEQNRSSLAIRMETHCRIITPRSKAMRQTTVYLYNDGSDVHPGSCLPCGAGSVLALPPPLTEGPTVPRACIAPHNLTSLEVLALLQQRRSSIDYEVDKIIAS